VLFIDEVTTRWRWRQKRRRCWGSLAKHEVDDTRIERQRHMRTRGWR